MKIKLNFEDKDIPIELVCGMIKDICEENNKLGATCRNMSIYMSLYDSDGTLVDITDKNGNIINFIFRTKPYKRCPKNVSLSQVMEFPKYEMTVYEYTEREPNTPFEPWKNKNG